MIKISFSELLKVNTLSYLVKNTIKNIDKPGLYIWGFLSKSDKFIPYYVGMTSDNIGDRLTKELTMMILNKQLKSNNMWRVTLHKNPEDIVFKRFAKPGQHIKKEDYSKLIYYNNEDFMKSKYGPFLEKISNIPVPGFANWEHDFCHKNNGISKLFNYLNQESFPKEILAKYEDLRELMDTYRTYIFDDRRNMVSDRLMFTYAPLLDENYPIDKKSMEQLETVLKFSLIENVGSKSNSPAKDPATKNKMEEMISFDGPDQIGELFYQNDQQNQYDKLFTWKR